MATRTATFNGTRLNDSNSNTNWGNWGSSGGAPASESPIAYQGGLAVNKKINSTTLGGIDYDPVSGGLNMTLPANRLFFAKVIASDSFDLNTTYGMSVGIGSANNAYYQYNVAGSGSNLPVYNEYPVQGGYLITAIDPNISAWRESTTGSPSLTAVDWFGVQGAFIVGAAKAENLAMDAIDVGTGLSLIGGTGADPRASYKSLYEIDQDIANNRWGAATGKGDAVILRGMHNIGDGSSAVGFEDTTSVVTFPDGYHSAGLFGITVNLSVAGDDVIDGALLISEGSRNGVDANDTRADYIVTGITDTATLSHQIRNFRNITYNANTEADGVDIECQLLTQGTAHIQNSVIKTNTLSGIACLQDPTFGSTTGLHDTRFIQTGVGHAIEIDTAGSYDFTSLEFSGYGADETNTAMVFNSSGGAVTINVVGGGTAGITVRNGAGSTTTINANTQVTLTGLPTGVEVRIFDDTGSAGSPVAGTEINGVESTATSSFSFSDAGGNDVIIVIFDEEYDPVYLQYNVPSSDTSIPFTLINSRNYLNP